MDVAPDSLRAANLGVLSRRAPRLAAEIAASATPATHLLSHAPGGEALLAVDGIAMHHPRDPSGDGVRWARGAIEKLEASGASRAIVVGLGLGYHVEALADRFPGEIVVVEPDLAVWRAAVAARDLRPLLERVVARSDETDAVVPPAKTRVLQHAPSALRPDGAHRALFETLVGRSATNGLRLRVLVVSPIAGGSLPIARYATHALTALGHEVRLLDLSGFQQGLNGLAAFGARRRRQAELESGFCSVLGMGVAAACESFAPDVVLALAQAPLDEHALAAIGRTGAIRALWFVEDFRRFTYWREVASQYDHVFTIQTDDCFAALRTASDARLAYLPCAFDPEEHRPVDLGYAEREALGSDVSFVGAGYRNRRQAFRRFLDLDFRVWGSEWNGAVDLERVIQRDSARISTEESVRIFNATRVNLNLHSSTYHDGVDPQGDFVNPRTFELAGCGAFQIVDRRQLLPDLFVPGHEIAVADSVTEMRELTQHYLAHNDERLAMTSLGHARALAQHTYQHRMQDLIGAIVAQDQDRLLARSRPPTFGEAAARESGALRALLERHPANAPLTLDAVVRGIGEGQGDVSEEEAIFLFLHQFQELYLTEARA